MRNDADNGKIDSSQTPNTSTIKTQNHTITQSLLSSNHTHTYQQPKTHSHAVESNTLASSHSVFYPPQRQYDQLVNVEIYTLHLFLYVYTVLD